MNQGLHELLETVFKRAEFLEALDETPAAKRELVDRLDVSRSTVNRGIWDLEQSGLVGYEDGDYRLTVAGRILYERHRRYEASVDAVIGSVGLLELLPLSAPLGIEFLEDADVYVAADPAPSVPVMVLSRIISGSAGVRVLSRSHAAPKTMDALREAIDGRGAAEIVFRDGVYDHVEDAYNWFADRVTGGDVRAYRTDDLPYGRIVADHGEQTYGSLVVYDGNSIAGVMVNDTDAAVEWATDVFERYRAAAEPVAKREQE